MKANSGMLCAVLCLYSATTIESQEQQPPARPGLGRAYAMGDIVVVAINPAVQRELGLTPMAAGKSPGSPGRLRRKRPEKSTSRFVSISARSDGQW